MTFPDVGSDYGYVVLVSGLIAFQCIVTGFVVVGKARSQAFTKEFLDQNFGDEHFAATQEPMPRGGYPDMGNGRYAAKLPYNDWLNFNKAQRVHYNLVEQVASMLLFVVFGGLQYPYPATGFGALFFVARILYTNYMAPSGASNKLRSMGALLGDIAILGGFGLTMASGINILQN